MATKPKTDEPDSIRDLTPDANNANRGTSRGAALIEHSLSMYGAGRSVLSDKHGKMIAGNKTLEAAASLGIPVKFVESDGKTLIVVRRNDLDLETDERARLLAYADNRTNQIDLDWDAEQIQKDVDAGVNLGDIFNDDELNALLAELEKKPIQQHDTARPPAMTWVLVGVPTAKYGRIANVITALAENPDTVVEIGVGDEPDADTE